jgi:predicted Fe-Mo cluster-binding NifX family protein
MKIAVTSTGPTLDEKIEARFGRCPYFVLVDPNTLQFESIPNPNISLGGGAGTQSAQLMAEKGVTVVLTGNCGPNAFKTFGAAGIQVITGVDGVVREAVERFKSGQLTGASAPSVQGHCGAGGGMGRGMGMGRGLGMGRGMGMGAGMGMKREGLPRPADPVPAGTKKAAVVREASQADLDLLKQTASSLRRQLDEIESRIETIAKQQ